MFNKIIATVFLLFTLVSSSVYATPTNLYDGNAYEFTKQFKEIGKNANITTGTLCLVKKEPTYIYLANSIFVWEHRAKIPLYLYTDHDFHIQRIILAHDAGLSNHSADLSKSYRTIAILLLKNIGLSNEEINHLLENGISFTSRDGIEILSQVYYNKSNKVIKYRYTHNKSTGLQIEIYAETK